MDAHNLESRFGHLCTADPLCLMANDPTKEMGQVGDCPLDCDNLWGAKTDTKKKDVAAEEVNGRETTTARLWSAATAAADWGTEPSPLPRQRVTPHARTQRAGRRRWRRRTGTAKRVGGVGWASRGKRTLSAFWGRATGGGHEVVSNSHRRRHRHRRDGTSTRDDDGCH